MKNQYIAALLNFLIPGVGYFYLRVKIPFAIMISSISLLSFYLYITANPIAQLFFQTPSMTIIGALYSVAFAYDGYQETMKTRKKK